MRITFVGAVPPIRGGIAQNSGNLVLALRRAGHDVAVESWATQYPHLMFPGSSQVRDDVEPLPGARFSLRWWHPFGWRRAGVAARQGDLLVVPWVTPFQGPAIATIARTAGPDVEVVALIHNSRPHEHFPLWRLLTRLGLRRVDRFVAHAPQVLDELAALGLPRPAHVVPHPPNVAVEASALPPDPVRLLFLGFVRRYKGADLAIRALAIVRASRPDARLTIAGEPWGNAAALHELAAELGVEDAVDFELRYLADHEISPLLAQHHLVLLPYRSATQSGVVPLAQAAARPVVATAVGGLSSQVEDGITGRLVPPEDVAALASAALEVTADLAAYSRRSLGAAPSWDQVAEVVAGSHPRADAARLPGDEDVS